MKRLAGVIAISATLVFGGSVEAGSEGDAAPTLVLSPATVAPGATFEATFTGCNIEEIVQFEVQDQGGAKPTGCNVDGIAQVQLTAPTRPGTYDVRATDIAVQVVATLTVRTGVGAERPMPATGPEQVLLIGLIAAGLVAGGLALVVLMRVRR